MKIFKEIGLLVFVVCIGFSIAQATDFGLSFSMRTPKKGNIIDWEVATELRGDLQGDPQSIRLLYERENGERETGRDIKLSRTVGPFLVTGQKMVKTAKNIDAQKMSMLLKGKIVSAGIAYSWLAWEEPRPMLDVQAYWKKGIMQMTGSYSTDFKDRQIKAGELRVDYPIAEWFTIGTFCSYLRNVQSEFWQGKIVFGTKL